MVVYDILYNLIYIEPFCKSVMGRNNRKAKENAYNLVRDNNVIFWLLGAYIDD